MPVPRGALWLAQAGGSYVLPAPRTAVVRADARTLFRPSLELLL
jgi:hypothetical protein